MLEQVKRRRMRLPERGVEIALLDWGGDGPLALLHHANGFCAAMWALVAEGLRDRFRLVAMDARGHGDSSKPEAEGAYAWGALAADVGAVGEALLEETGAERIALGLGHSFGGTLTLAAAGQRPELYGRLVLVDPVILAPMTPAQATRRASERGLVERARKRRDRWPSREQARSHLASRELFERWDPRALDLYVQEALRESEGGVALKCPPRVESTVFAGATGLDVFALAPRVTAPVRILRAARGDFPRAVYDDLAALLRDASIEELEAGHLIPMEQPELVVDAVLRFAGEGVGRPARGVAP